MNNGHFLIIPVIMMTASCGGGGSSDGNNAGGDVYVTAKEQAANQIWQYLDMNGQLASTSTIATPSEIINSPTANYSGYLIANTDDISLISELDISVNFAENSSNTTAHSFIHEEIGNLNGTLTGTGLIHPNASENEHQFTSTIVGTLSQGNFSETTSLALDANFLHVEGNPTGAIAGTVDGRLGSEFIDGSFAVD